MALTHPSFRHRYLSYLVPDFLRRRLIASTLRTFPPNRQGLEASVVTDVKLLRKCAVILCCLSALEGPLLLSLPSYAVSVIQAFVSTMLHKPQVQSRQVIAHWPDLCRGLVHCA